MINVSEVTSKKMWPCSLLWVCCRTRWRQSLLLICSHFLQEIFSPQSGTAGLSGDQAVASPTKILWVFLATGHRYKQYSVENDPLTDQPTHRPTDLIKGRQNIWILDQPPDIKENKINTDEKWATLFLICSFWFSVSRPIAGFLAVLGLNVR